MSFGLRSNNRKCDGVTRAQALNTCVPLVLCASSARLPSVEPPASNRNLVSHGETLTPTRCGVPYWVELGSVTSLRGIVEQGLDPKISEPASTESGYKPGLLVSEETVKGSEKYWLILIGSGA